jgi:hypothetical protein
MKRYTIPVTLLDGHTLAVTVLANDEDHATIVAMKAQGPSNLAHDAHDILSSDYAGLFPSDVVEVLERAVATSGPMPAYAVKSIRWAMKQASFIEAKAIRDEQAADQVLRNLPASERNRVGV